MSIQSGQQQQHRTSQDLSELQEPFEHGPWSPSALPPVIQLTEWTPATAAASVPSRSFAVTRLRPPHSTSQLPSQTGAVSSSASATAGASPPPPLSKPFQSRSQSALPVVTDRFSAVSLVSQQPPLRSPPSSVALPVGFSHPASSVPMSVQPATAAAASATHNPATQPSVSASSADSNDHSHIDHRNSNNGGSAQSLSATSPIRSASSNLLEKLLVKKKTESKRSVARRDFIDQTDSDWFSSDEPPLDRNLDEQSILSSSASYHPSSKSSRSSTMGTGDPVGRLGLARSTSSGETVTAQSAPGTVFHAVLTTAVTSTLPAYSRPHGNLSSSGSSSSLNVTGSTTSSTAVGSVKAVIRKSVPPAKEAEPVVTSRPIIYQQKGTGTTLGVAVNPHQHQHLTKENDGWVLVTGNGKEFVSVDEQTAQEITNLNNKIARMDKFKALLEHSNVDLEKLKKMCWNGIPEDLRSSSWRLLMGYMPSAMERRKATLAKKRKDYADFVVQSFGKGIPSLDQTIYHQIHIDVPRTHPSMKLYQQARIQQALERVLYCWAIRHPASGYVQGINDISTPFFQVYLSDYVSDEDLDRARVDHISDEQLQEVEADTFWCLSKLLDGIQDNYTHGQPGILRQIQRMKDLISRIDMPLYTHIQAQGIDFIQFAFRWINCLLMRELSVKNVIRMWDTYLAEGPDGFSDFHIYVCAAFVAKWSDHLRKLDFQDIMMFLQALPTKDWGDKEVEVLLSEAFMWKSLFHNAPSHFATVAAKTATDWSI